jgi:hypothetical protein
MPRLYEWERIRGAWLSGPMPREVLAGRARDPEFKSEFCIAPSHFDVRANCPDPLRLANAVHYAWGNDLDTLRLGFNSYSIRTIPSER